MYIIVIDNWWNEKNRVAKSLRYFYKFDRFNETVTNTCRIWFLVSAKLFPNNMNKSLKTSYYRQHSLPIVYFKIYQNHPRRKVEQKKPANILQNSPRVTFTTSANIYSLNILCEKYLSRINKMERLFRGKYGICHNVNIFRWEYAIENSAKSNSLHVFISDLFVICGVTADPTQI